MLREEKAQMKEILCMYNEASVPTSMDPLFCQFHE